jgi:hypothetical protein
MEVVQAASTRHASTAQDEMYGRRRMPLVVAHIIRLLGLYTRIKEKKTLK